MAKRMLIDALHLEETRVVIADEKHIYDFDFVSVAKKQLKGNIYLAKITRVEPSLQAAFVEYGGGKQGFLPFSEIHHDYYQLPVSDRKRLMEEAQRDADGLPQLPSGREESADQPADIAPPQEDSESPDLPLAPPIEMTEQGEDANNMEAETPSYLKEGTADISTSEDVPPPEQDASAPADATSAEPTDTTAEAPADTQSGAPQKTDEQQPGEAVETIQNEEEEIRNTRAKRNFFRRYRIQEVIRRGQVVLVQVIKEERGNKGVSLTTYLSLAGRYCVLMPNSPKDGGISRKIASGEDRKRLKAISTELRLAAGMSAIIRTAGMDRTRAEIKRDYDYLVKLWNQIREDTLKSNAPALIYEESDVIKRALRDQYTSDIEEVLIEGEAAYKSAKEFMKLILPSHTARIKQYKEPTPLFYAYNIEEQLLSMHDPSVKLRSGGYIVMNPTEALISIDVNSGRATGERNIEETATKTNLEAAVEIARQLRLRDLAGLIVIDFIDMLESRNRRAVERTLKDALKADRAKIQLGRISPFGLLEMSRQRLRPSISETNMVQCPHCIGRGYIRSNESMSIQMIRALEKEASTGSWSSLKLIAPQTVALHLLNTKRDLLRAIEQRYEITLQVLIDSDLSVSDFSLEKIRRPQSGRRDEPRRERRDERSRAPEPTVETESAEISEALPVEEVHSGASEEAQGGKEGGPGRRRRRGRRGGRGRHRSGGTESPSMPVEEEMAAGGTESPPVAEHSPREESPKDARGERGGRGRRRWRGRGERDDSRSEPKPVAAGGADARQLPSFATQAPVLVDLAEHRKPAVAAAPVESTPRDPNKPARKGWWQKMIELDE